MTDCVNYIQTQAYRLHHGSQINRGSFCVKMAVFLSIAGFGINLAGFLTPIWTSVHLKLPLLGNRSYHLGLLTSGDVMKDLKRLQKEGQRLENGFHLFHFFKFETSDNKDNETTKETFGLQNLFHFNNQQDTKASNSTERKTDKDYSKMADKLFHTFKSNHSKFQELFLSQDISKVFRKNITNKFKHHRFGRNTHKEMESESANVKIHQQKRHDDPVLPAKSGLQRSFKGLRIDCMPAEYTEGLTMESLKVVLKNLPGFFKLTITLSILGELAGLFSITCLVWYMVRTGAFWVYCAAFLFTTTAGCNTFIAVFVYSSEVPGCLGWSFYLCTSSAVLYLGVDVMLIINIVINRKKDEASREHVKYSRLI